MVFFSFITFFITQVFAVEGHFSFQGQSEVLTSTRYETVYTPADEGKLRMQELLSEGYTCEPKLQFMQCSFSYENDIMPVLNFAPKVQSVTFGPIQSIATLYQGDSLLQYEAQQKVIVNGKVYPSSMYYESKDFVKVTVGTPDQNNYYSFVVNKDSVSYIELLNETESKWAFKSYWIESALTKI
jgi:hypothetical protein